MRLQSNLTCRNCGHVEKLTMPQDACVIFHICASCGARLRPKPGDCCVFCSYGDVPCPPIQRRDCCAPPMDARG
ncbi:GDCCVxC domain-containing (seleno)protein [Methylocystis sp. 9N]|uniref:GDCCVxC domain-containing (Seleno)protein n=1 Tax=Methylocystis borbori TaxID=3118750 RepID=A0ABU7XKS0_9HYPH